MEDYYYELLEDLEMPAAKNDSPRAQPGCPSRHYVAPIALFVVASVGIIANLMAIFIIFSLKEYKKSVSKIYILHLAFADFIFVFPVFFQAQSMLIGEWTYGSIWCKICEAAKMLSYYSSVGFLTLMSVDRYMAINLAMNQNAQYFRTTRVACIGSVCVWCVAIAGVINIFKYADVHQCECAIYFPENDLPIAGNKSLDNNVFDGGYDDYDFSDILSQFAEGDDATSNRYDAANIDESILNKLRQQIGDISCSLHDDQASYYFKTWIVCNFLFSFLLPYIVMSISCVLTLRRIKRPMTVGHKSGGNTSVTKRLTRVVLGLAIAFIVCWLPYHSFNLARLGGIRMKAETCNSIINVTLALAYSNSAINPIFYIFLSTTFRERLINASEEGRTYVRQCMTQRHRSAQKRKDSLKSLQRISPQR